MDKLQQAAELIGGMTDVECRQVFDMARRRISALQSIKVLAFRPGDKVTFTGRNGRQLVGTVKKLNQKTASVEVPSEARGRNGQQLPQVWRVSPSLLEKAP